MSDDDDELEVWVEYGLEAFVTESEVKRRVTEARVRAVEHASRVLMDLASQHCSGCDTRDGGVRRGLELAAFAVRAKQEVKL